MSPTGSTSPLRDPPCNGLLRVGPPSEWREEAAEKKGEGEEPRSVNDHSNRSLLSPRASTATALRSEYQESGSWVTPGRFLADAILVPSRGTVHYESANALNLLSPWLICRPGNATSDPPLTNVFFLSVNNRRCVCLTLLQSSSHFNMCLLVSSS